MEKLQSDDVKPEEREQLMNQLRQAQKANRETEPAGVLVTGDAGGALVSDWFWRDYNRSEFNQEGQTGLVHLPIVRFGSLATTGDQKRYYLDYVC